jgi:hypothetical protein
MSSNYLDRMIRAARLDVNLYREVKEERQAFAQAMGLVILASVAAGVGASGKTGAGVGLILLGALFSLISWFVWAFLIYYIGTRFLPEPDTQGDYGQLLRTIGFSSAPGILNVLGVMPQVTVAVFFVVSVWSLVAMVVAVRVALNYSSSLRAAGVCAVGWILQLLVFVLFGSLFGKLPAGPS